MQKTAYEIRISDGGSDVCSSDLKRSARRIHRLDQHGCFQRAASTQFADRIDREALEIMASDRKKRLLQTKLLVLGLANARLVQFRSSIIIAVARGNAVGAFVQALQKAPMTHTGTFRTKIS